VYCGDCDIVGDLMFSQEGDHKHNTQYFKFQGIYWDVVSVGRIIHVLFRAAHAEENNVPHICCLFLISIYY